MASLGRFSLTVILVPVLLVGPGCQKKGEEQLASCKGNLLELSRVVGSYSQRHRGQYPGSFQELTHQGFLREVPTCPTGGTYLYSSTATGFSIECTGDHKKASPEAPKFYNHYSSNNGLTYQPR